MRSVLMRCFCVLVIGMSWCSNAEVVFDRPGLLFSAKTLSSGAATMEVGVTNIRSADDLIDKELDYDAMVRLGIGSDIELQFEFPMKTMQFANENAVTGFNDMRLGARVDLHNKGVLSEQLDAVALQWGLTVDNGKSEFSQHEDVWDLGIVTSVGLSEHLELSTMLQLLHSDSEQDQIFGATLGMDVAEPVSIFVDTAVALNSKSLLVGTGLTWMLTPQAQFDAFIVKGTAADDPDWQTGLGFSMYFP